MSLGSPRPSPSIISFSSESSSSRASTPTLAPSQLPPDDKLELATEVHPQIITAVETDAPTTVDIERNCGAVEPFGCQSPTNCLLDTPTVAPPTAELGFGRLLVIHAA